MAVKLVATIQNFVCLSSDAKPTAAPEGSTLHIIDTGEQFIFYSGSWEQDLRMIYALTAS